MRPVVLIVDDEPAICDNLSAYLEDEGMDVHVAHSGEEAVQRFEAGLRVQVCILDLRLPGMDGNDTAIAIHQRAPAVRFIIHTGSTNYVPRTELQCAGLTEMQVFPKPMEDMGALAAAVRALWAACEREVR